MKYSDEEALDRFRIEVCERGEEIDPVEELDWYSLSIGFFIALGLSIEKARELATKARYTHQYWV